MTASGQFANTNTADNSRGLVARGVAIRRRGVIQKDFPCPRTVVKPMLRGGVDLALCELHGRRKWKEGTEPCVTCALAIIQSIIEPEMLLLALSTMLYVIHPWIHLLSAPNLVKPLEVQDGVPLIQLGAADGSFHEEAHHV